MSEPGDTPWPAAELGPLRRLRVIAGTAKNPVCAEHYFDVAPERLWGVVSDLERELPQLLPRLRSFTPQRPSGERFDAVAVSTLGHRENFQVLLKPGWCLMQSKLLLGAMAAEPEGTGTRFAFLSGYRFPGGGSVQALRRVGAESRSSALFERLRRRIEARDES